MKGEGRLPSVHMDLFIPVKEEYKDAALAERWDLIMGVRREATKALEIARREKRIGHSLDATLTLGLSESLNAQLAPYRDQLKFLFIVSSVNIVSFQELEGVEESSDVSGLKVKVESSRDPKCERCWIHDPTIGDDNEHPTICHRCVTAIKELGQLEA